MPPAARVGDATSDGAVITGPGAMNVLIGGMPAAVAGDIHPCPAAMSALPFPMGSTTVLIGGKPALRTTDMSGCGAMPLVGCPTVIIGG